MQLSQVQISDLIDTALTYRTRAYAPLFSFYSGCSIA